MVAPAKLLDLRDERSVLRASIAATLIVAAAGVLLGLASGSFSIMFDGIYSIVDAGMSLLSLIVVNLINSYALSQELPARLRERFTMGFWHLEPIVLALNGLMLMGVALYALFNAVSSLLTGGRDLEFGIAIVYAGLTLLVCIGIATLGGRANREIRSEFVDLDVKAWLMSGGITAALLVAFSIGYAIQGTPLAWLSPYIDPAVLAIICLVIVPMPVSSVRRALSDILLMTPVDMKKHVDAVCERFVREQGFISHRAYVAKVGRARDMEIYFIVPPGLPARTIAQWDALRDEVADAIGEDTPDRWLTIVFTEDLEWA